MDGEGIVNSMVTCNMFEQPVFKDGALTSNDPRVRAYARQKGMRAIDMGASLGATIYVMWGGREGLEEVWDLVCGCMRSYPVLRDKARRFNTDAEIQALLGAVPADGQTRQMQAWSPDTAQRVKEHTFDLAAMANRPFGYQRLDQLTFDLLTGVR